MRVRQVVMTPELATTLMAKNTRNRILTPHLVTAIAAAMHEGRFLPEAAGPVVLGEDGSLHDGQHRLAATIESGANWPCILIEDASDSARMFYDTGKKRTFADLLRVEGVTDGTNVAAALRLLWFYEHGLMGTRTQWLAARSKLQPDYKLQWDYYQKNQDRIHAGLVYARRVGKVLPRSAGAVTAIVLSDVDEDDCEDFYRQLAKQTAISPQVAVLLRSLEALPGIGRAKGAFYGDQQHQMALAFKAWNLWRDGGMVETLRWRTGGRGAEAMPVPH